MLKEGTRVGPYEIGVLLGAGGMGEVYRARDTRLDRDAALKILPDSFAADADRLARFEREAKTLAALNHPHIAAIYGLEDGPADTAEGAASGVGRTRVLAMELVEGEDLSAILARGPLPLDEALPMARQIAEALEAAHAQGVVHRDLKPANIKVRADGTVKVLDFGLAKAVARSEGDGFSHGQPAEAEASALKANSPTITSPAGLTRAGIILGTAAYMAPEQARGRVVDARADIFAFGCVLYEMLTGHRAFGGEDIADVLARVIERDPDWARLPTRTPALVTRLLHRALQKDRTKRLQHMGDARLDIDEALATPVAEPIASPGSVARSRAGVLVAVAVIAAALGGALVAISAWRAGAASPPHRAVQFDEPTSNLPLRLALSPDGRYLAQLRSSGGQYEVWLRDLSQPAAERLGTTDGGSFLGWSPDGLALLAGASNGRMRFDLRTRSGVLQQFGGQQPPGFTNAGTATLPDGRVVLGGSRVGVITHLRTWGPSGLADLLPLDTAHQETRQAWPSWIASGLLSYGSTRADGSVFLCVTPIDLPRPRCAGPLNQTTKAFYHAGQVVFGRGTSLLARGFDLERAAFTTDDVTVAAGLDSRGADMFSASDEGTLAFMVGSGADRLERMPSMPSSLLSIAIPVTTNFALSPDGRQVLHTDRDTLVLTDLVRGGTARLGPSSGDPIWAPDGRRVAHRTQAGIVIRSVDDPREQVLVAGALVAFTEDWSRDGRWIVAGLRDDPLQIALFPVGGGEPIKMLPRNSGISQADEMHFSPDGKWVAFNAISGVRDEVFVMPLPPTGQRWQVSTAGGVQARWQPSGRTLHYLSPDGGMMAVAIAPGAAFSAGAPTRLFDVGFPPSRGFDEYRIGPDGRFLVKRPSQDATIRVIVNWPALLNPRP